LSVRPATETTCAIIAAHFSMPSQVMRRWMRLPRWARRASESQIALGQLSGMRRMQMKSASHEMSLHW
jgi:hypothetical protein